MTKSLGPSPLSSNFRHNLPTHDNTREMVSTMVWIQLFFSPEKDNALTSYH